MPSTPPPTHPTPVTPSLLRIRGTRRALLAVTASALPIAAMNLTVLLLVQQASSDLPLAALTSGTTTAGTALGILCQGHLLDRFGPRRVLPWIATAQCACVTWLILTTQAVASATEAAPVDAPAALQGPAASWVSVVLVVAGFGTGLCEPHVVGSVRGAWRHLVPTTLRPQAAVVTSRTFELAVLTGPLLLAAVVHLGGPSAALALWSGCFCLGTAVLVTSPAGRRTPHVSTTATTTTASTTTARAGRRLPPAVRALVAVGAGSGVLMGLVQVAAVDAVQRHGGPGWEVWTQVALSVGSVAGVFTFRAHREHRLPRTLLALAVATACASTLTTAPAALVAVLVAVGWCGGRTGVLCFLALDRVAAPRAVVSAFAALTAASLLASAVGTAGAGWLTPLTGPSVVMLMAAAAVLVTTVGMRRCRP